MLNYRMYHILKMAGHRGKYLVYAEYFCQLIVQGQSDRFSTTLFVETASHITKRTKLPESGVSI